MSPNRAFLGKDPRLPNDLVMGTEPDFVPSGDGGYVEDLRERMHKDGELVRTRLGSAAEVMKRRYDAKNKPAFDLSIGQSVWYQNTVPESEILVGSTVKTVCGPQGQVASCRRVVRRQHSRKRNA